MTTFQRYMLLQVPGWLIDIAVLAALMHWWNMPLWGAGGILALLVIKDFVLYPFLRVGYETNAKSGIEQLIGEPAVVKQTLNPEGYVLIRGELWKARATDRTLRLEPGASVRIESADGMLLLVSAAQPAPENSSPIRQ